MFDDREQEILYLAHQLWEEDLVPGACSHTYWQEAARQILALGRPGHPQHSNGTGLRDLNATRRKIHFARGTMQYTTSPRIEMGRSTATWSVSLVGKFDRLVPSNSSDQQARRVE
ncbi:MAG: hypothetical protein Q4P24_14765 [Rhodobacterales bacterium]|nr:hypothetical protein [Rhodobacterales bacterium]